MGTSNSRDPFAQTRECRACGFRAVHTGPRLTTGLGWGAGSKWAHESQHQCSMAAPLSPCWHSSAQLHRAQPTTLQASGAPLWAPLALGHCQVVAGSRTLARFQLPSPTVQAGTSTCIPYPTYSALAHLDERIGPWALRVATSLAAWPGARLSWRFASGPWPCLHYSSFCGHQEARDCQGRACPTLVAVQGAPRATGGGGDMTR